MKYVWVFCVDYGDPETDEGGVCGGVPSNFHENNIRLIIKDDNANEYDMALDEECADGNIVLIATIDNSREDVKLINESNSAILHGLENLEQLVALTP